MRDDGKGLNRDKLLKKARERGIDAPDTMTDQEVCEPDLRAGLLDRRASSPTSPAAASAWTSSRRTSPRSAARSRSTRPRATA
ncbi:MAG: hypothetical protein MZW92_22890 [Comamonadaceae bacterium]|nr:hypothetical protein [Comamonadaceae bacterium]